MEFLKQQFRSSPDTHLNQIKQQSHYQSRDLSSPVSAHKSRTSTASSEAEESEIPQANGASRAITNSPNATHLIKHSTLQNLYNSKGIYMSQSDISDLRQSGQNNQSSQIHHQMSQMAPVSHHHQHQMSQIHLHNHHNHQGYTPMSQQQQQSFLIHSQQMGYANENERDNSVEDEEEDDDESNNNSTTTSNNDHFSKEYTSLANYNRVLGNGAHHGLGLNQPPHHQALLSLPTSEMQSYIPEDLINSGIQHPSKKNITVTISAAKLFFI